MRSIRFSQTTHFPVRSTMRAHRLQIIFGPHFEQSAGASNFVPRSSLNSSGELQCEQVKVSPLRTLPSAMCSSKKPTARAYFFPSGSQGTEVSTTCAGADATGASPRPAVTETVTEMLV